MPRPDLITDPADLRPDTPWSDTVWAWTAEESLITHARKPRLCSAALLPFTLGVFGEVLGRSRVDAVLKGGAVDPAHHATIQATGYAEAAQCKKLGTGGSAAPGLVALVALGLALSRREPAPGQGQGPGHGHGPGPDHGASG